MLILKLILTVLCKHHEVHTRSIRQILDNITQWKTGPGGIEYQLPFQNFRYRTSVRVIDFFPPNLEGFAVPYNSDNDILYHAVESTDLTEENGENQIDTEDESNIGKNEWEWRFCLLVEDGGPGVPRIAPGQNRERLHLFVAGRDAEFLLDMDAVKYVPIRIPTSSLQRCERY